MRRSLIPAILGLCLAGPALAAPQPLPNPTPPLKVLKEAKSLPAWQAFCEAYASECAVDVSEPARTTLDAKAWAVVRRINSEVNGRLRKITDLDQYGIPDKWTMAENGTGDNEEFALAKRSLLVKAGLPRRSMRVTVVINEKGEGHAVLCLVTDRGDLILDQSVPEILPWYRTGYVFIKREGQDALGWVSLGGVASPTP